MSDGKRGSEHPGWQRAAAAGGAISVVLVGASALLENGLPHVDSSAAKIASYYADKGHWHQIEAGVIFGALSTLFFVWFLSGLYVRLRDAEGDRSNFASLALAAGVAFAALFGVLNALRGGIGEALAHSKPFRHPHLDPQLVRLVSEIGAIVYVGALVVGAVLIAATSVVALRSGVVPSWLGWVGAAISLVILVGAFIFPSAVVFLLLLWVLAASVALVAGTADGPSTADTAVLKKPSRTRKAR